MQAARGTPLNPSEPGTGPQSLPAPRRLIFLVVLVTAYAVDVVTKVLAVDRLSGRPDVEVIGDFLTLRLVRNPGAAFSMGTDFTVVLSLVAIVAALVMGYLSFALRDRIWALGLGLAMAGVLGNLTDRLLRDPAPLQGHVIDFLRLPNWPVFNVADICINVGIGLIVLQVLRGIRRDGTRESDHASEPDVDAAEADAAEGDPT